MQHELRIGAATRGTADYTDLYIKSSYPLYNDTTTLKTSGSHPRYLEIGSLPHQCGVLCVGSIQSPILKVSHIKDIFTVAQDMKFTRIMMSTTSRALRDKLKRQGYVQVESFKNHRTGKLVRVMSKKVPRPSS